MPRSRIRRRSDYTPPPGKRAAPTRLGSGRWVVPTMLTLMLLGLLWLCVYYLAGTQVPGMSALGAWNVAVGMGLIVAGFLVSTRWK